jgi:hypothetical protein
VEATGHYCHTPPASRYDMNAQGIVSIAHCVIAGHLLQQRHTNSSKDHQSQNDLCNFTMPAAQPVMRAQAALMTGRQGDTTAPQL